MDLINQSTTPAATSLCTTWLSLCCGHPSFKRRGNYYERTQLRYFNTFVYFDPPCKIYFRPLSLTAMPFRGRGAKRRRGSGEQEDNPHGNYFTLSLIHISEPTRLGM